MSRKQKIIQRLGIYTEKSEGLAKIEFRRGKNTETYEPSTNLNNMKIHGASDNSYLRILPALGSRGHRRQRCLDGLCHFGDDAGRVHRDVPAGCYPHGTRADRGAAGRGVEDSVLP